MRDPQACLLCCHVPGVIFARIGARYSSSKMGSNGKLYVGAAVIAASVGYVAYLGASSSYQYYALVDECVTNAAHFQNKRVRVSGRVADQSLVISDDRSQAKFVLCGQQQEISVTCGGPLPDNLTEGMDVVVEGKLTDASTLHGDKVITRCASKYESQQNESADGAVDGPI